MCALGILGVLDVLGAHGVLGVHGVLHVGVLGDVHRTFLQVPLVSYITSAYIILY